MTEVDEQKFELLFEGSPVAIGIESPDQKFIRVNRSLIDLLGYTEGDLLGLTVLDVTVPEDREASIALRTKLLDGEVSSYVQEKRFVTASGEVLWAKVTVTAIHNRHNQVEHIIEYIEDIGTNKELAEKSRAAQLAAEKNSQAKTDFLATMSHEIRTPLSAILGFSDLLQEKTKNIDELHDYVLKIRKNTDLLRHLVEDMLDISRIEAGKMNIDKKYIRLADVLAEVVTTIKPVAEGKGLFFDVYSKSGVPVRIFSDPVRLKQVLINIIGNAIKFTDRGEVLVEVEEGADPGGSSSSCLLFTIRDTGIGISEEQQEKLFSLFGQADNTIIRRYGGTGLGLILSKRIAKALGGDITLTNSFSGKGSEFVVAIDPGIAPNLSPVKPFCLEDLVELKSERKRLIPQTLASMNVLVVDDSEEMRNLIGRALQTVGGAQLDFAENGKVALSKATMKNYDLILMDSMMPVMDGYEATKLIRKAGVETPIVALSARTMKSEIEKGLSAGCDQYLAKPIEMGQLVNVVRRYKKKAVQREPNEISNH